MKSPRAHPTKRPTPNKPQPIGPDGCGPSTGKTTTISTPDWNALATAASGLGSFIGATGPEILAGEGIISKPPAIGQPLGQPIGNTTTWVESGGGPGQPPWWNEVWDTTDLGSLNHHFRLEQKGDLPNGFDGNVFLTQPPPNGTWRSHLRFQYAGAPTNADIAALPPTPAGATILRFNVYNGPSGDPANAHTGRLFRLLGPNDEVMEFWSLWHDYQFPDVGDQDMWVGPDTDPVTGSQDLIPFLQNMPDTAQFVFAHFTWQHF